MLRSQGVLTVFFSEFEEVFIVNFCVPLNYLGPAIDFLSLRLSNYNLDAYTI